MTPLNLAATNGHLRVVEFLKNHKEEKKKQTEEENISEGDCRI